MVGFVRELKREDGSELRVMGSLSIMKQLLTAGLLDRLRLMVCPLNLPESGAEPIFKDVSDTAFTLGAHQVLDGRVLVLDYAPDGCPPVAKPGDN